MKIRGRYYSPTLTEAQYREALSIAAARRAIPSNKELLRKHYAPNWMLQKKIYSGKTHAAFWVEHSMAKANRKKWRGMLKAKADEWGVKPYIISEAIRKGIKTYDRKKSCAN